ncbi:hypothetical protein ACEPU1_31025, partial [Pseudomonas aeruginosa]
QLLQPPPQEFNHQNLYGCPNRIAIFFGSPKMAVHTFNKLAVQKFDSTIIYGIRISKLSRLCKQGPWTAIPDGMSVHPSGRAA